MRSDEAGVPPLAFVQLLNSHALNAGSVAHFRRIIAREFASETELVERDEQVPVRWFREVYPDLDTDSGTLLGLAFAQQAQLTSFGPLSLPLVSASSVSEIFELLGYLPVISTALRPHFHHSERGLTVGLSGHTGDPALDCLVIAYAGSALLRLLDMLAGTLPAVTLKLAWAAPRSQPRPDNAFGARLMFDSPASFVDVPADILHTPCQFADPVAYRMAINELRRTLDRRSTPNSFTEHVRRLLEQDPGRHLGCVAGLLAVSPSTMKRRLNEEGTTFRIVRQSLLRERAILRLLDRSMSVSQIAADLGYGDLTNFSHAFKRWSGQSPTEFRSLNGLGRDE